MKTLLLTLFLTQQPAPPTTLQLGQCYHYHRTTGHGNEVFNPFWFRLIGRKGRTALMQAYSLEWQRTGRRDSTGQRVIQQGVWSGPLRQNERKLTKYSRCVPCSTLANLASQGL